MSERLEKLYTLVQTYPKRAMAVVGLLLVLLALPLTLSVSQKQQNLKENAAGNTGPLNGYSSSCVPPLTTADLNGGYFNLQQFYYVQDPNKYPNVDPTIVSSAKPMSVVGNIGFALSNPVQNAGNTPPVSQAEITYAYTQMNANPQFNLNPEYVDAITKAYKNISAYTPNPPPLCTSNDSSGTFCTQNLKGFCSSAGATAYCASGNQAPADCGPQSVCCVGGVPKQPPAGANTISCKQVAYGRTGEQCVTVPAGYGTYQDAATCSQFCGITCPTDTTGTGDCTQHVIEGYVYIDSNGNGQYDPGEGYNGANVVEQFLEATTKATKTITQETEDQVIGGMTDGGYRLPIVVSDPYSSKEIYVDPTSIPNGFKVDPSNHVILNDTTNDAVISFKLIPPAGYTPTPTPSPTPIPLPPCNDNVDTTQCFNNNGYSCSGNKWYLTQTCNSNQTCRVELNGQPVPDGQIPNGIGCINATPSPTPAPNSIIVYEGQICGTFTTPERLCAQGLICDTSSANVPGAGVCVNPNSSTTPTPFPTSTAVPTIKPSTTPKPSGTPAPTACIPACANPPAGCHYQGGGTTPSNCTCGTLICSSPTPTPFPIVTPRGTPIPPQNTPVPTPLPSQTPHPTNSPPPPNKTNLFFANVGLDGIGNSGDHQSPGTAGNLNPRNPTRNVSIEILNQDGNILDNEAGTLTYDPTSKQFQGFVTLSPQLLSSDSYYVKIKTPGYLKKQFPGAITITANQDNNLPPISLTAGDVVDDNSLNLLDYNVLLSCSVFSKDNGAACKQNPNYAKLSDLNDDGFINQDDYNLLLREWGVQSGQ